MEKLKRYIIFIIGLYINSFGVSLITKAALGTSPISSIPYVLSLNFPFTLGQFTIFFSILLIVLQLFILGKNFKLEHALQIPVSIAFGYFIDFSMFLLADLMPQAYVWKMIYLLLGCLILGIGVYAEVLADVVMLPGESFVRAIVFRWNTDFGITKICFDVSMAVIAVALSFVFAGKLNGVREGTIIAAILVGFIARLIGRKLSFLPEKLFPAKAIADVVSEASAAGGGLCILIGRQYGSGVLSERSWRSSWDLHSMTRTSSRWRPARRDTMRNMYRKMRKLWLMGYCMICCTRCMFTQTRKHLVTISLQRNRRLSKRSQRRETPLSWDGAQTISCWERKTASAYFCSHRRLLE